MTGAVATTFPDGQTLHSYLGLTVKKTYNNDVQDDVDYDYYRRDDYAFVRKRVRTIKVRMSA